MSIDDDYRNPFQNFEMGPREGKVMHAVIHKNMEVLQKLIEAKTDIEFSITDHTPLMTAIQDGSFEIANYLMDNGASVLAKNRLGFSVMHFAVKSKNLELIEKIAKIRPITLESQTQKLETPLFTALAENNLEIFSKLISLGANINHVTGNGRNLLSITVNTEADDYHKKLYAPFKEILERGGAVMPEAVAVLKEAALDEREARRRKEAEEKEAALAAPARGSLSSIRKKGM